MNLKISKKELEELLSACLIVIAAMVVVIPLFIYMLDRAITIEDQFRQEQNKEALKMYKQTAKQ